MRRLPFVCSIAVAVAVQAVPLSATVVTNSLNFATVGQNLWGPGTAFIIDESVTLPPPAGVSAHIAPGTYSGLADFVTDFLDIDLGARIAPSADISASLRASLYVNSGSLDLNYPMQASLNVANEARMGQAFTVSLTPPSLLAASLSSINSSALVASGGGGYALPGLSQFMLSQNVLQPRAGFSTQFPFAEARVDLSLSATGQIASEICFIVDCIAGPTVDLGRVDFNQQLFELNTLTGLKVLDEPVVSFDQTIDVVQGIQIGFHSPTITLDGTLRADGTLRDSGSSNFLDVAFNVNQLIPIVGQLLQSNIGPIGYNLLSVSPALSFTLRQAIEFDPRLMVALQFDAPVRDQRDGRFKNLVIFEYGESVDLLPTLGGGIFSGGDLRVKPTFFLDNSLHNVTSLVLDGSLSVDALALMVGPTLGPLFQSGALPLFDLPLLDLVNDSWLLDIPPITAGELAIPRTGILQEALYTQPFIANAVPGAATNSLGHALYRLETGGGLVSTAYGEIVQQGSNPLSCFGIGLDFVPPDCQTFFIADDDVWIFGDGVDAEDELLGRLFCIVCNDLSNLFLPDSPGVTDDVSGDRLLLSDLSSFAVPVDAAQLLDPASDLYSPTLAESQFHTSLIATAPRVVPRTVPEPGVLPLLAIAAMIGWRSTRAGQRNCNI
ncbi:MAG: hypothetical protein H6978_09930 [Gammaproteobacteria bacterium]|nr:hypothetical protein [Gammaproteobacteria bacterium]